MSSTTAPLVSSSSASTSNIDNDGLLVWSIVFQSGFLGWYDSVPLKTVSKTWNQTIADSLNPSLFEEILEHLKIVNSFHKCGECGIQNRTLCNCRCIGQRIVPEIIRHRVPCSDPMCQGCVVDILHVIRMDPRLKPHFSELSTYQKAREVYCFHATCVQNFIRLFEAENGTDFTKRENPEYDNSRSIYAINSFGIKHLFDFNPNAHNVFLNLMELDMACYELRNDEFIVNKAETFFESAFAGRVYDDVPQPCLFRDEMLHWVYGRLVENIKLKSGDRYFVCNPDVLENDPIDILPLCRAPWGKHYYNSFRETLQNIMDPEEKPQTLLGLDLANKVDVMYKARLQVAPLLEPGKGLFPLNPMPCDIDGYCPEGFHVETHEEED